MTPSDLHQDVAELWDAVNGLRQGDALIMAKLASIESLLTERCASRAEKLESFDTRLKAMEDKYHVLDKTVLKVSFITGAITALLSSATTATIMALARKFIG